MGSRKLKTYKNNLNHGGYKPERPSKMILHCGGVRKGSEGHIRCVNDNTVQADFSVFKSQSNLHSGLLSAGWLLAAAKNAAGDQVFEPICGDCRQVLIEYMVEQKKLRDKMLAPELDMSEDVHADDIISDAAIKELERNAAESRETVQSENTQDTEIGSDVSASD